MFYRYFYDDRQEMTTANLWTKRNKIIISSSLLFNFSYMESRGIRKDGECLEMKKGRGEFRGRSRVCEKVHDLFPLLL